MIITSNHKHPFATVSIGRRRIRLPGRIWNAALGKLEFNLPVLGVLNEPLDVNALQHYGDIIPNLVLSEPRQMPMRIGWLHL